MTYSIVLGFALVGFLLFGVFLIWFGFFFFGGGGVFWGVFLLVWGWLGYFVFLCFWCYGKGNQIDKMLERR